LRWVERNAGQEIAHGIECSMKWTCAKWGQRTPSSRARNAATLSCCRR
jgi:hypothetical protein